MTTPEPGPTLRDPQLDQAPLAPDLGAAIRLELEEDEEVVWAGRPRAWRLAWPGPKPFAPTLLALVVFGWFAVEEYRAGVHRQAAGRVLWILIPAYLFGLAAPIREWFRVRRTSYVLTDRRAIVRESEAWHGRSGFRVRSYRARDLRSVYRAERPDGSGDLVFREDSPDVGLADLVFRDQALPGDLPTTGPGENRLGFLAVDDVRAVDFVLWSTLQVDDRPAEPRGLDPASPPLHDLELDRIPASTGLDGEILPELDEFEKLIWVGRPRPWRMVEADLFRLIAGVGLLGFSIFSVVASFLTPGADAASAAMVGLGSIAGGVFLLGYPITAWNRGLKMCYALTDRRAIIREPRSWMDGGGFLVHGYPRKALRSMYRAERADGSGDLVFAEVVRRWDRDRWPRVASRLGFLGVEDVRSVERLVRSTLKEG